MRGGGWGEAGAEREEVEEEGDGGDDTAKRAWRDWTTMPIMVLISGKNSLSYRVIFDHHGMTKARRARTHI
jgi:hypothetical protein